MADVEIRGQDEIIAALKKLAGPVARKICKEGVRAGGKLILKAARANAPERTGTLKKNIKLSVRSKKDQASADIILRTGETAKQKAKREKKGKPAPPPGAYYGSFVEFGSKHNQPQHYLQRAGESEGDAACETALDVIEQGIDAAW